MIWLSANIDFFIQNFLPPKLRKFHLPRLPFYGRIGDDICPVGGRSQSAVCGRRWLWRR